MRPAASSCSGTGAPSATSPAATQPHLPTGSSSSSTTRRSGSQRTRATSWPCSTRTCPRRRGRRERTSRTSACGTASPTSSTRCRRMTWPPSASKAARSKNCRLRGDAERAQHPAEAVRIADDRVATRLERDPPRALADESDRRGLVHSRPAQAEVVTGGLVLDLDRVRAALERLHTDTVLGQLDLEVVVDLAPEPR